MQLCPFLTIFDKSYRALQKFELFNFWTFSKNSFARTFSHPTLIIPESFTQIGPAISEIINHIQLHLHLPPLHTSNTKSSLASLARFWLSSYHPCTLIKFYPNVWRVNCAVSEIISRLEAAEMHLVVDSARRKTAENGMSTRNRP